MLGEIFKKNSKLVLILKVLVASYIITGIGLLTLSLFLLKLKMSNSSLGIGVICVYIISTFVSGFIIGKITKEKKYFWGFAMGFAYFTILSIISFIVNRSFYQDFNHAIAVLGICVGSGMLGGMLS